MNKKETIRRKNERKLKYEAARTGFDIDVIRLECNKIGGFHFEATSTYL